MNFDTSILIVAFILHVLFIPESDTFKMRKNVYKIQLCFYSTFPL